MSSGSSLLLLLSISTLMSLVILGSMRRADVPGLNQWLHACWAYFAALFLLAVRDQTPALIGIIAANALLGASVIGLLLGCRRFFGRSSDIRKAWATLAAMMVVIAYGTYVEPNFNLRVVAFSAFNVYVFACIVQMIRTARQQAPWLYSYRFVLLTCTMAVLGHTVRGLVYGFDLVQQTSMLDKGLANTIFLSLGVPFMSFFSIGMVLLSHDRLVDKLEKLADIDELTRLLRRRTFLTRSEAEIQGARREGQPLALVLLDLDHFKTVNDTYGHAGGDAVLAQFAKTLTSGTRATDLIGRLGGEEFAILCRNTSLAQAAALMERLRATFAAQNIAFNGKNIQCTFSAGIAALRPDDTLATLMARADAMQYAAKAAGRNRVFLAENYTAAASPAHGTDSSSGRQMGSGAGHELHGQPMDRAST